MNVGANGGRFDFDDGGTYCGGWNDGKAHGHGVCTGPKGQGEYSGAWQFGYEFSGIYLWPSGNSYEGQWMSGKRHGLGVEKKGKWIYKGEWTQGFKGRYGTRISDISGARYEGTWANGLQDGYGVEIYADGGIYHGQIQQGLRHGFGIRRSVPYGLASRYRMKDVRDSLTSLRSEEDDERTQRERDKRMDENRGGFVLRARSEPYDLTANPRSASQGPRRGSLSNSAERRSSLRKTLMSKLRKQKSTSDIEDMSITKKTSSFRSTASSTSGDSKHSVKVANMISSRVHTLNSTNTLDDGDHSFISQEDILDSNVVETYMGEWKADKRTGFGIAERSDGLKYEGEWFNNKKNGYGVTTFRDGTKEEGKYKNNVLVTDKRKPSKLFLLRASKLRDKLDAAVNNAMKAATTAQQKAEIAMARANNARSKAHSAEIYAKQARADSIEARTSARAAAPDFRQPGEEKPQPFIILDIDRQVEGKVVSNTQLSIGSPNGRLPMSSNYAPNSTLPMPMYLSQAQTNHHPTSSAPFLLDGGVYQGQPPPPTTTTTSPPTSQQNQWNVNSKMIGPISSPMTMSGMNQQNPEYYLNNNYPPKGMPSMPYNDNNNNNSMPESRPGMSAAQSVYPPYGNQMMNPGDFSTPRNPSYEIDRTGMMTNSNPPQFVTNPLGVGPRIGSTRPTITRSNRVIGSNEDLLNDPTQSQSSPQTMNSTRTKIASPVSPSSSSSSAHESHHRPRLLHGAGNSANSSGHDSGLSSGGTSFDPDQHPIYNLGNPTSSMSHPNRSTTPQVEPYEVPAPVPIPKRKSLPSIVKTVPNHYKVDETARSNDQLSANETFIIENGIRKRVTAQPATFTESGSLIPEASVMTSSSGSPILARRVLLESITKLDPSNPTNSSTTGGTKRTSMPTLVNIARHRHEAPSITREEASMLGSRRREELRRQRDFDSTVIGRVKALLQSDTSPTTGSTINNDLHAYTQEIAIQTDTHQHTYRPIQSLQNVVYRNRVFIAIFFLNLSLALWFIQLLR